MTKLLRPFILAVIALLGAATGVQARDQWTPEQANAWYQNMPWLRGCNFTPSSAINELEMWQADTFDPKEIDRELGWAEQLGLNSMRVFLHDLLWQQDKEGFLKRIDEFLAIADKHHVGIVFVLLDACWDPHPKLGKQHEPTPHVHNSGWVQSPGAEILGHPERYDSLKPYIVGVISHFRGDKRIHAWDLFNEPDNVSGNSYKKDEPANKPALSLQLLEKEFRWAREANPSQPLTSAPWLGNWGNPDKLSPMEKLQLEESDVISFHNYSKLEDMKKCVENLKRYHRPILCTEYMARPQGSTFDPIFGYLKEQKTGAYNWGFVSGKTQTIYPWDSWQKTYNAEPPVWFHDILRTDGTPYRTEEVHYIKRVTGKE